MFPGWLAGFSGFSTAANYGPSASDSVRRCRCRCFDAEHDAAECVGEVRGVLQRNQVDPQLDMLLSQAVLERSGINTALVQPFANFGNPNGEVAPVKHNSNRECHRALLPP